jgi:quercetin dioxygenase-like cupin family protein
MHAIALRRWLTLVMLAAAVSIVAPVVTSPARPVAALEVARPTTAFEAWFDVQQPPTLPMEAVQMVVDFPAGSRVGRHVHGGPGYITMIANVLTMWIGDAPMRTYSRGESFVEPFKLVAEGANLSSQQASVIVTYLLPVGAPVTTLATAGPSAPTPPSAGQLPPGASPRFESRMRLDTAPERYQLGQMVRTYTPGAWTLSEMPDSPRVLTVVSGEVTVLTGATERAYTARESWTETPGQAWLSGNTGTAPAEVVVSIIAARS